MYRGVRMMLPVQRCISTMQIAMLLLLCLLPVTMTDQYPDDWLDPNDMINFDPVNMKMVNKQKKAEQESPPVVNVPADESVADPVDTPSVPVDKPSGSVAPPDVSGSSDIKTDAHKLDDVKMKPGEADVPTGHTEYLLFRQYVQFLVKKWQSQAVEVTPRHFDMNVKLSLEDLDILHNFAKTQSGAHDAHHVLTNMLVRISPTDPPPAFNLDDYMGISLNTLVQLLAAVALAVLILRLAITIHLSWQRIFLRLFILLFFISIPWTWYHEYKKAVSEHHSSLMKEAPSQCYGEQSKKDMVLHWLRSTFTLRDDPCKAYYEKLLVDPIWTINPAEAFAMTVVRFFIKPMGHIGQGLSSFIRGTLSELPAQLWPFLFTSIIMIIILVLFMGFGYSLRLPFFITVEPSNASQHKRLENDFKKMIEHNETQSKQIKQLLEAIEPMRFHPSLEGSSQPETLQHGRAPHSIQHDVYDGGDAAVPALGAPNRRELALPMITHRPGVINSKSASYIPDKDSILEKDNDLAKSASCQHIRITDNPSAHKEKSRMIDTLSDSNKAKCDPGIENGDQAERSINLTENLHIKSDTAAATGDVTALGEIDHFESSEGDAAPIQTLGAD